MSSAARILAVDDEPVNLQLLERILERAGYEHVETTTRSAEVLARFEQQPPDLLLLDLMMPDPDGFEVLRLIEPWVGGEARIPVLVLTADASPAARHRALASGARDFLTKPLDHVEVLLRIGNLLTTLELQRELQRRNWLLDEAVRERTLELDQARLEAFRMLALAAEYRDDETKEHTLRVGRVVRLIALELGMDEGSAEVLEQIAPLHDLGKIGIPDAILLKPGRLTDEEFATMREHARIGGEILGRSNSPLFRRARDIARSHHERWDGSGYPDGLAGEQISLDARIVGLVDAFDAMTHERPYKPAWPLPQVLDEVRRCRGAHFDPRVVDAFLRLDHAAVLGLDAVIPDTPLSPSAWRDLHDREELQLSPAMLERVFEQAPSALVVATDDGRCVTANAAARALLRVTPPQLRGRRVDDFARGAWNALRRDGGEVAAWEVGGEGGARVVVRLRLRADVTPGRHLMILHPVRGG